MLGESDMPTCIVVDDEKLARERMHGYLASLPDWNVIAESAEYQDAEKLISALQPDVCFMDIDIIGGNGVDLVQKLSEEVTCQWVFTTAYSEYAPNAFELNATDYLLKPFENSRLSTAIEKLEKKLDQRPKQSKQILAVKSVGSVQFVNVNDIIWIKGAANYVELHCKDKMMLHRETLLNLEKQLNSKKFVRVHRSAMVNVDKISALTSELGRFSLLQLANGDEVKISTVYKPSLFMQLGLEQ